MEHEQELKKKVFVKTFGCQMNEYDTEKMLMLLSDSYDRVEEMEAADLVLVNTCSVREKGEHKLFGLLGRLRDIKKQRPDLIIGVGGCVAQQEGHNIITRNSAVDFVVGTHNISLIPSMVKASQNGLSSDSKMSRVAIDYRDEWEELPDEFDAMPDKSKIVSSAFNTSVRALVAIQRGCDKKCAFCVVPMTRGPQVSRALDEIVKEIKLKVRMGAKEVLLLGQTVNSYGLDLSPRVRFSELVKRIAELDGVKRIRFTSPHPAEIRDDFIRLLGEIPALSPQIHMPLQSGSNRILKAMNRNYKRERYLEIINSLRQQRADVAISTDVIVGFPTETEEEFEETLEVMRIVKFNLAFSFKYSIRPHTKAISEYQSEDEVPECVKTDRLIKLQKLQEIHTLEFNSNLMGKHSEVLVESVDTEKKLVRGRNEYNIFSEVYCEGDFLPHVGSIIVAPVVRVSPHGIKLLYAADSDNKKFVTQNI